jgi:dethiobiotin synthetase
MSGYFITGTDTGVGKTLISAVITLALEGYYWKPVQSGIADDVTDTKIIQTLTDLPAQHFFPSTYKLQASLSPNQAAAKENIKIDLHQCQLQNPRYPLVVEGAGGICVPLNSEHNMLDLMQQLALPVIIVSRGTLGTINHTLLSVLALREREIPIHGIVFSGELNPDNQKNIEELSGVRTLFHLPWFTSLTKNHLQHWVDQHRHIILEALT